MKRLWWLAAIVLVLGAVALVGAVLLPSNAPTNDGPTAVAEITGATPPAATNSIETIIILHTNDLHGAVEPEARSGGGLGESGGLVNLVSLVDELRLEDPERTLLLDAGDTLQGTYVSNSTQGQVVVDAMNAAGYDAWALGNHEFDWGQDVLRARVSQADFPALAANLLDTATGETWDVVEPYAIIPVGRANVAILGLAYPDTPTINKPENVAGLTFSAAEAAVRRYLPELESEADLIVVLSHLGYDGDRALASAVSGIDLIIGGHTHTFLEPPAEVNNTIIAQAGIKGQVVGRLELTVDLETGMVKDYARGSVLIPVTDDVAAVNQEVQVLVDVALDAAKETMDQPIGEVARTLQTNRSGEFALGNLVVDAMLASWMGEGHPADIAMHNNGGIRADLLKGPVTFGQLYAVLPFDNQLVALDLTGEQVLSILEHSVAERAGNMQVAGMTFRFSMSEPVGQRVLEATVGDQPLDPERVYRVVTIDYLATGGDGQEAFLEGTNVAYGDGEVWAVADYVRDHSPVDAKVEGRIVQR
jgi:5'-nucleotidase/UDP-sugar diphosphatase